MSTVTQKNFASRNRRRQSEFRKQQVIDATIDCIDQLGISQTTLARIAERSGLSQGNVVFHFKNKDTLLEQTLMHLNEEHLANWRDVLAQAGNHPRDRLLALIEASFAPAVFNRRKISVWFAFWGESRSKAAYMRICGANDQAFSNTVSELCIALHGLSPGRLAPQTAATSIEGIIDAQWQNLLLGPPGFKRGDALAPVIELLDCIYPHAG
ncbi:MAG: TetR family transcriptional regulator C-terminal domain-containing protein [Gammaproteobacteria bacterium]|nr:TetR family transcriptional regulator C-terminal domain-containing protein [Gammaproteobacteria bacterium]